MSRKDENAETQALELYEEEKDTNRAATLRLEVSRKEFARGMKALKLARWFGEQADAVVSYEGGCLTITVATATVQMDAVGTWDGIVLVPMKALEPLVKVPPESDPVVVQVQGDYLRVAQIFIPCIRHHPEQIGLLLPDDAPLWHILQVAYRHSREQIEAAGLAPRIDLALAQRDKLLMSASVYLGAFGVTDGELRRFVDKMVRSKRVSVPRKFFIFDGVDEGDELEEETD